MLSSDGYLIQAPCPPVCFPELVKPSGKLAAASAPAKTSAVSPPSQLQVEPEEAWAPQELPDQAAGLVCLGRRGRVWVSLRIG